MSFTELGRELFKNCSNSPKQSTLLEMGLVKFGDLNSKVPPNLLSPLLFPLPYLFRFITFLKLNAVASLVPGSSAEKSYVKCLKWLWLINEQMGLFGYFPIFNFTITSSILSQLATFPKCNREHIKRILVKERFIYV